MATSIGAATEQASEMASKAGEMASKAANFVSAKRADRNVGNPERVVSAVAGSALALWGLTRGPWAALGLAAVGGSLIYRGLTGVCSLYSALGIDTRSSREAVANDPIGMLEEDHQKVKGLFAAFQAAGNATAKRKSIADKAIKEIEVHATLEEEIFYPAFRAKAGQDHEALEMAAEAIEEHRVVKTLIAEIRGLDAASDEYAAKFKVMSENVEHHAEEEEREMFPKAEELLADDLERLGTQMKQRKQQLMGLRAAA